MNVHPLTGPDQPMKEKVKMVPESLIPVLIDALEYRYIVSVSRNPKSLRILLNSMGTGHLGYLLGWVSALETIGEKFPVDLERRFINR